MPELTTKIGAYDKGKRTVAVTFISGEIEHKRDVNAVHKDDDSYDKAGTKARVAEVALGVAHKIGLGLITAPAPEPKAPIEDAADSATAE
ncbi:MAG: hypothetical protein J7530_12370 [Novosphingobium sp.]|nr:hypothetical protein [Novosphingobium sp.]